MRDLFDGLTKQGYKGHGENFGIFSGTNRN